MWPFTRKKPESPVDPSVLDRLAALEKRVDTIDVEWSEWYDKYRRLYARLAKRVHDDKEADAPPAGLPHLANGRTTTNPLAAALLRGPHVPGG